MNDSPFEAALRATLQAAAPLEVPARLEDRARDIPAIAHPGQRWWSALAPRTWGVAIAAAVGVIIALALRPAGRPRTSWRWPAQSGSDRILVWFARRE